MKDLISHIKVSPALAPASQSAATTGAAIDTVGFASLVFAIHSGAIVGDGDFAVKVQHSDTTTSGDFVDAPAAAVQGSVPATLEAASAYKLAYVGSRRYARIAVTKAGGTSIALGATAIQGHASLAPVA